MPNFLVTEYQRVRYTWVVEAPDAETAQRAADGGVPDAAYEKLTGSDVEVTPLGTGEEPDQFWCATCEEFSTGEPCDQHEEKEA